MKKLFLLLLTTVTVLSFSQCSKDSDGEAGPKGEQGEQGPKGDKGDKGDKGTANVIYSDWITVKKADWARYMLSQGLYHDIDAPKLTNDILNKGVVLVYMNRSGVKALPYAYQLHSGGGRIIYEFEISKGKIKLFHYDDDGSNQKTPTSHDAKFRYVLIPGGVKARRSAPLPDFNDYEAVAAYYGIPE